MCVQSINASRVAKPFFRTLCSSSRKTSLTLERVSCNHFAVVGILVRYIVLVDLLENLDAARVSLHWQTSRGRRLQKQLGVF